MGTASEKTFSTGGLHTAAKQVKVLGTGHQGNAVRPTAVPSGRWLKHQVTRASAGGEARMAAGETVWQFRGSQVGLHKSPLGRSEVVLQGCLAAH